MKTRATSFLLATLAVVSFILPAFAAAADELPEETAAKGEEIEEVLEEAEEVRRAVLLNGEPAQGVEFDILNGVCYVTVSSFVSLMDAEAMVEEENGYVSVSASAVVDVVALDQPAGFAEVEIQPAGEGGAEALSAEAAEEVVQPEPAAENTANVVTDDLSLSAAIGSAYLVANGRYLYVGDGLIQLNGRVAAPVRVLARVFNLDVAYEAENELVLLSDCEGAEPYLADAAYDGDALYWLSRIIHAESGNQSLEGKIAVGNVVMNRVKDPRFPDNIYDVLFQKNQFTPAFSGSIYQEPNEESVVAAMLVLDGAEVTPTALFFNGAGATRSYAARTRTYLTTIGDHAFYR